MRVLVTGAAGFVGTATVAALTVAGHRVRALDILPMPAVDGVEVVVGELAGPDIARAAVEGVEGVVHLAGGHWDAGGSPVHQLEGSVVATAALFEAAADANVSRIVLMSSSAILAGHPRGTRIDRATGPSFQGLYPLAKWLQEEIARRFAAGAGGKPMTAPILRPWVVIDAPTRRMRTGASLDPMLDPLGHDGCFGWIDRHDLAYACLLALTRELSGAPVFHLMANPIGRALFDVAPAIDELAWRPEHDFASDIPPDWRLPDGWPVAA